MRHITFLPRIRTGRDSGGEFRIRDLIRWPEDVKCFTYGNESDSDYRNFDIELRKIILFSIFRALKYHRKYPLPFPGIKNIDNLTAAIAIALKCELPKRRSGERFLISKE